MRLSVVIPTLDEEGVLGSTLQAVHRSAPGCEIVVTDGGSHDATLEIAGSFTGVRAVSAPRGRGPALPRLRGARVRAGPGATPAVSA